MILDAKVRLVQNSAVKVDPTKQRTVIKSGLEKTCPSKKILVPQKKIKIFSGSHSYKRWDIAQGVTQLCKTVNESSSIPNFSLDCILKNLD